MDLPTCPACKQSVLDDDAEDCPFCGASMKTGKPGKSKPPAPVSKPAASPAKTATAAPTATAKTTAKTAKSSADAPSEDDDPFAVETASQNAVPVSPKKAAGRTYEVVCPMCEAKGYIPASAAGRDVKCHNKHCMMPVYTAPAMPKVEAPPPPPAPKSSSLPLYIGVTVVCGAIAGGAYWFFTQQPAETADKKIDWTTAKNLDGSDPGTKVAANGADPNKEKKPLEEKPEEKVEAAQDFRKRLLSDLVDASQDPNRNRSKPLCRRMTAMAFAFANDLPDAQDQIEKVQSLGKDTPFYQINPLTIVAWEQLKAGRKAEAAKTLDKALALTKSLPAHGADSLDTSLELATVLVAVGKGKEAAALLSSHQSAEPVGQTSALLAVARATRQFNLDRPVVGQSLSGWNHPQWVAAVVGAAAHGYSAQAKSFLLDQVPEGDARIEATVALADLLAREALAAQKPDEAAAAAQLGDSEGDAALARSAARVAQTQIELDDRDGGTKTLALAIDTLKKLPDLPPLRVGSPRQMLEMNLPDPVPVRQTVLAQAAVARAEATLGNTDAARQHLLQSMDTARGLAPSPAAIAALQRQLTSQQVQIRNELKKALELSSDDAARRKVNELRRKVEQIEQESKARFDLQLKTLEAAIEWGLPDAVWAEIRDHSDPDAEDYEPYLTTSLPKRLLRALDRAGKAAERGDLENLMQGRKPVDDPLYEVQVASAQAVADKKYAEAARALKDASPPHSVDGWGLRLACRIVDQSGLMPALQYATSLEDPLLREDALRIIGSLAGKRGEGAKFWKEVHGRSLPQTEQISAGLGISEGMSSAPDTKPAQ